MPGVDLAKAQVEAAKEEFLDWCWNEMCPGVPKEKRYDPPNAAERAAWARLTTVATKEGDVVATSSRVIPRLTALISSCLQRQSGASSSLGSASQTQTSAVTQAHELTCLDRVFQQTCSGCGSLFHNWGKT